MRALARGAAQEGENTFSSLNRVTKVVNKCILLRQKGGNVLHMIIGPSLNVSSQLPDTPVEGLQCRLPSHLLGRATAAVHLFLLVLLKLSASLVLQVHCSPLSLRSDLGLLIEEARSKT